MMMASYVKIDWDSSGWNVYKEIHRSTWESGKREPLGVERSYLAAAFSSMDDAAIWAKDNGHFLEV